jgi:outer membrane protein OmpA-like peptidoglycan-associated protein
VEIDNTPPEINIDAGPRYLKPGKEAELLIPFTFDMSAYDRNGVADWELIVTDFEGKEFFTLKGAGDPPHKFVWDGKGDNGEYVETGRIYYYSLKATDMPGNSAQTKPVPQVILLKEIKLTFSSDALFAPGEASVKTSAYRSLKETKKLVSAHKDSEVIVSGHTDSFELTGNYGTKKRLSEARAKAIKFFMINLLGITGREIRIEGHGDELPVADNNTEEGRKKNRRVEVIIRRTMYE